MSVSASQRTTFPMPDDPTEMACAVPDPVEHTVLAEDRPRSNEVAALATLAERVRNREVLPSTTVRPLPDAIRPVPAAPAVSAPPVPVSPVPPPDARRRSSFLGGITAELVAARLLTERRAVALAFQARETGETLMRVIARETPPAELEAIYEFMAEHSGRRLLRRKAELIQMVMDVPWLPPAVAEQRGILMLRPDAPGEAPYAALDPHDLPTRDWVGRLSGKTPLPVPVLPDVLEETIGRLRRREDVDALDKPLVPIDISWEQEERIREKLEACEIPVIVDYIVQRAYEQDASDIHIEPGEDGTVVRTRIDGILHEECRMPVAMHAAVASRIKVLAGMDVAERRRPQDGRITAQIRRLPLDMRVSTSPTVLGEKVVMRLLDEKALRPTPERLGLRDDNLRLLLDTISSPHGLLMLSGPTGSGKTTTLYSCLSALDRGRRNILTIEDPVEYRLKGVHQMQVNEKIGLTFAGGLRNILRQDPDVIMVGECRDVETAKMAIQASLTGHVVFSTIHANDSVGVISRLLDMGIDPYLVASALTLPIAQRLVRAVCPKCKVTVEGREMLAMLRADGVSDEKLTRLGMEIDPDEPCLHAPGCQHCRHTGYVGRQAVYEMFGLTEPMRELIASASFNADELRHLVRGCGTPSMLDNALGLVSDGLTTCAEVVRVFGSSGS